jgi:hypothetical protein
VKKNKYKGKPTVSKFHDKDFNSSYENDSGTAMGPSEDSDTEEPIAHDKEPDTKSKKKFKDSD